MEPVMPIKNLQLIKWGWVCTSWHYKEVMNTQNTLAELTYSSNTVYINMNINH